jgi:alkanesulfonate monooxygenase SsuD/methylene tetrahydromethanopterin reductase-like flavin-dependent oxidoreductase (luciferase family)
MKFGILTTPVWGKETDPQIQFAAHKEVVQTAEQLGFSAMVAGQHFLGGELRYYQPVPYLTYLSQFAPTMDVVIGIILLSLVNPVETAEQVATMDAVTGGKAVLGVGLGYSDHEFRAFGIPKETRVKRFEEGLELIKQLWSGDEVNFHGQNFVVEGQLPAVLPVRRPRPPIWIGGQGEKAIRRAARTSDAWYAPPFPTHEGLARLREVFLEEREIAGLPIDGDFPLRRELLIADSRDEARELAKARSELRFKTYLKWGLGERLDKDAGKGGFGSQSDEDIDSRFILGTAEQCAEELDRLRRDLGMTHFMFKPQWPGLPHEEAMKQIELFGTRVIPLVQQAERRDGGDQ